VEAGRVGGSAWPKVSPAVTSCLPAIFRSPFPPSGPFLSDLSFHTSPPGSCQSFFLFSLRWRRLATGHAISAHGQSTSLTSGPYFSRFMRVLSKLGIKTLSFEIFIQIAVLYTGGFISFFLGSASKLSKAMDSWISTQRVTTGTVSSSAILPSTNSDVFFLAFFRARTSLGSSGPIRHFWVYLKSTSTCQPVSY